jgi:dTDP-4-dehydrorhamnose reductase
MKNVLVCGNGYIASHLKYEKIKERATINPQDIRSILQVYKPDVIVNAIGFCGSPNIDQCEIEKEKTLITNVIIPSIIATECNKLGIHHIMIGSGCIFQGKSPNIMYMVTTGTQGIECDLGWRETDFASPPSYYSNTKYACDLLVGSLPNTAVLRIRMPISSQYSPRNFISKVKNYKQVIDIPNSATFLTDLVRCIDWMIENKKTGIYNVVNPEPITAARVMKEYQKYIPEHQFSIISGEKLDKLTKAKRSNCILDGSKLRNEGFIMTDTKTILEKTMKEYVENMRKQ